MADRCCVVTPASHVSLPVSINPIPISFHLLLSGNQLCEMVSPTWKMYGGPPGLSPGPDGIRELFGTLGSIEQTWTIEDIIAEGDKVVVRATNTCLQESFFGVPAHGKQQTFTATFIHRIVNGKIVETWRTLMI